MTHGDQNYGKKGSCLGKVVVGLFLFAILLVWIYYQNQNGLN